MRIEWQIYDEQTGRFLGPVLYTEISDEDLADLPSDDEREGQIRSIMNDQFGCRIQWRIKHRHGRAKTQETDQPEG